MKQITLSIPDDKMPFFLELINNLDFISISEQPEVSDNQKQMVLDRKNTSSDSTFKDWDEIKATLKVQ
jgi:hypothetical protein